MTTVGRRALVPLLAALVACGPSVTTPVPTPSAGATSVATTRIASHVPASRAPATASVTLVPQATVATGSPKVVTVVIGDDYFAPAELTVYVGTTVIWVDYGRNPHSVTAHDGAFGSAMLVSGSTFSYTFTTSGRHTYICMYHPDHMLAELTVVQ